ncbi:LLM class F420-dependent oxidoreductase [Cryptosporangium minutisporangium]|uniref:LLM class F420-dependent oxidoreductase n=1 Tax=Cryptosporangium minutisporangium TaxID=113569 RepID=A0ABP6SUC1_9ACTN
MQLGLQLGYWGAAPPADAPALVAAAEESGFAAVYTAEAWGSDAFTPLAWWGAATERVRLGTAVVQISARTPAACAMHALTLDHLSGGRFALGLGVSGPQVVEGWYGEPFAKPLARTREYVRIVRQVLAREAPVVNDGPHHPLPYRGPGALGLGKPLRPITHPLRADLPILLGAEGPKNVALAGEIADGWIAVFYSPRVGPVYAEWLAEGLARPGARRTQETFEVVANCQIVLTDDRRPALDALKPSLAHYIGGMGAPGMNFHADLFTRAGFGDAVAEIGALFQSGQRAEAVAAVPDALVDEVSIVGDADHVRAEVARREEAGVTMLLTGCRTVAEVRALGSLLGADARV